MAECKSSSRASSQHECSASKEAKLSKHDSHGALDLAGLSPAVRAKLMEFDKDGNGALDAEEIEAIVNSLAKEKFRGRYVQFGFLALFLTVIALLGCTAGIMWAVILAAKDTKVVNGVLINRKTGTPVQVLGHDITTGANGLLTQRRGGAAITTGSQFTELKLSSSMSREQLASLTRVRFKSSTGAEVGLRVTGFAVKASSDNSPPVLHLSTPTGMVVVRGEELAPGSAHTALVDAEESGTTWPEMIGIFAA
ncbi:hypothetical protein HYH03_002227 [Edaphochlamys debaryana]|uniref:EF-hand domain-containing protein n=1 Tax=Edaphochlamys debaryana TaxID=47281 RepID=A0A835YJX0_9CHLO|nr:hypothetical protein HYH03_002227 [Edaphochlamys debaryana]|eukprot:KAG2499940.1 hypothetical protein HYH03_002227 [Edaphochlamys debaryana]